MVSIIVRFRMMSKRIALLFFILCSHLLFSYCFAQEYTVKKVIDGDTILLSNGLKVRYIGIDAPEMHHKNKDVAAMGEKAKEYNKRLVMGKKVTLEYDVETHDKYGRAVAYVYADELFVNAAMLKEGYAMVYTLPPNVKYQELFLKLQRDARDNGKGLWSDINQQGAGSSVQGTVNENSYVASKAAESFHFVWCKWAKKISKENRVYFKTREEAMKALHRPCHVCKP